MPILVTIKQLKITAGYQMARLSGCTLNEVIYLLIPLYLAYFVYFFYEDIVLMLNDNTASSTPRCIIIQNHV